MAVQYECCTTKFWIYVGICLLLVLFAGMMSGLTLGLMSLSLVDLEVLRKSGKPKDRKHAGHWSNPPGRGEVSLRRRPWLGNRQMETNWAYTHFTVVVLDKLVYEIIWYLGLCRIFSSSVIFVYRPQYTQVTCSQAQSRTELKNTHYGLVGQALPIFLDGLVSPWGAILISVTLILLFGEIIPQSVCSRYGLAVGATLVPMVRVLVWICFPVSWPISKLLDLLLGKGHDALFRRAELKTLVNLHGNEAGKGGELTHDETTIIAGALELTEKTAEDAMTPISETFAIDVNAKLDKGLMNLILRKGHSRVPIYYEQPTNIIGLVLVKNLLSIHPGDEVPVKNVTIRKIPRYGDADAPSLGEVYECIDSMLDQMRSIVREKDPTLAFYHEHIQPIIHRVPVNMPLYDILNEFQKGHSHMAVVVRYTGGKEQEQKMTKDASNQVFVQTIHEHDNGKDVSVIVDKRPSQAVREKSFTNRRSLNKLKSLPATHANDSNREAAKSKRWSRVVSGDILEIADDSLPKLAENEKIVGIITMEDVIEELLQEEIFDETDFQDSQH